MPRFGDESGFKELIRRHSSSLPPQQRAIADFLVENLEEAPFLSIPDISRRVGTSEATVVRFAQRIGFKGFAELKMSLVELLQERLGIDRDQGPPEQTEDVLGAVARLETANISRSAEALDRAVFMKVAEALFEAHEVVTFGLGVSSLLAQFAAYTLSQAGIRAWSLSHTFSSPCEQLVTLDRSDLLVAISFPPYSRATLDVLSTAQERGITSVAVCDRITAPAASIAKWSLPVRSDNLMFTNSVAGVTVLFNALATQVATAHRSKALDAITAINRILSKDRGVIPPEG